MITKLIMWKNGELDGISKSPGINVENNRAIYETSKGLYLNGTLMELFEGMIYK